MLKSKERAYLRGLANGLPAIFQVGKGGVTPELSASVDGALAARELIKLSVLETSMMSAAEAAEMISERTRSEIVQVIGNRFVLYRKSAKKPVIDFDTKKG